MALIAASFTKSGASQSGKPWPRLMAVGGTMDGGQGTALVPNTQDKTRPDLTLVLIGQRRELRPDPKQQTTTRHAVNTPLTLFTSSKLLHNNKAYVGASNPARRSDCAAVTTPRRVSRSVVAREAARAAPATRCKGRADMVTDAVYFRRAAQVRRREGFCLQKCTPPHRVWQIWREHTANTHRCFK